MNVTVLTWGTRGDLQPYVALGHELQRRGHKVTVAAQLNQQEWVSNAGLEAFPLPLDGEALIQTQSAREWLASGKATQFLKWMANVEHEARDEIIEALIEACSGADLIVSTFLLSYRAHALAEKADIPMVEALTFPIRPTVRYSCPYLKNGMPKIPFGVFRRWSHELFLSLLVRGGRSDLEEMRRRLGLEPLDGSPEKALIARNVPAFHLFSETILPRPDDWHPRLKVTGFCRLPEEIRDRVGERGIPEDLARWLDAGPAPVFFGFGSMPVLDPTRLIEDVRRVCRDLGLRGLIGAGWTNFAGMNEDDDLFLVKTFNHDAVLPRCRAAVHHGGAGTTATALSAGLPTVVCSVFADQPLWGHRVRSLGAGTYLSFQRLNQDQLRSALEQVLRDEVTARAKRLGELLRAEDGVSAGADAILSAAN